MKGRRVSDMFMYNASDALPFVKLLLQQDVASDPKHKQSHVGVGHFDHGTLLLKPGQSGKCQSTHL